MATNDFTLSKSGWTLIGVAPMFIESRSGKPVYWSTGTGSAPPTSPTGDIADAPQHLLGGEGNKRDVAINFTGQNVYARGDGAFITVSS